MAGELEKHSVGFPAGSPPVKAASGEAMLTAAQFLILAEVPAESEWFANIANQNTRRAYRNDVGDFMRFVGITTPLQFRLVKRSHLIAWRAQLKSRSLEASTIRRKLSAVASLFDFLCENNAVPFNPVDGVKRPNLGSNEGKSPALGDEQAKAILNAPAAHTLKGVRDRAILSTLLFHGLRRAELCSLKVNDVQSRRGVMHFLVNGKGGKIRYVPIHPHALQRISDYLAMTRHGTISDTPLFQRVDAWRRAEAAFPLTGHAIYRNVVQKYARVIGLDPVRFASMGCVRLPQPTLLITVQTLPRFRIGWGTRIFQRPVFMTGVRPSRRIHPLTR